MQLLKKSVSDKRENARKGYTNKFNLRKDFLDFPVIKLKTKKYNNLASMNLE